MSLRGSSDTGVWLNHAVLAWLAGRICPQRDSNPRCSLERAVTWAASRWGPARIVSVAAGAYAPVGGIAPLRKMKSP